MKLKNIMKNKKSMLLIFLIIAGILLYCNSDSSSDNEIPMGSISHDENIYNRDGDFGILDYSHIEKFPEAFVQAREDGEDFFWWNDKLFNSKLKD